MSARFVLLVGRSARGDMTRPVLSSPSMASLTIEGGVPTVTTNEGNGTLYYAVLTDGGSVTNAQIKAGAGGNIVAGKAGSVAVTSIGVKTFAAVTGLTSATAYEIVFLQTDLALNDSTQSTAGFTTNTIALSGSAASVAGYNITVTATSDGDLSAGVFGVEYGIGSAGVYTDSVHVVGVAASQSITAGILDGIIPGNYWSLRPYFNLTAGDPTNTRVYGAALTIFVSEFDGLLLGQG